MRVIALGLWLACSCVLVDVGQGKSPSASKSSAPEKLEFLRAKVDEMNRLPVFEFGEVVGSLINDIETKGGEDEREVCDFDVDILYTVYTERLCRVYCQRFLQQLNELISDEDMSLEALRLLKVDAMMECEKAMDSGRPQSRVNTWDFKPALRDLELDIDKMMKQIDYEVTVDTEKTDDNIGDIKGRSKSKLHRILHPTLKIPGSGHIATFLGKKSRKRLKWVFMQSLVLLFNFAQNEITRRTAIRMIEKKLAEVPEFPLL